MKHILLFCTLLLAAVNLSAQDDILERITGFDNFGSEHADNDSLLKGAKDANATWIHYYFEGNSSLKIFPNPATDRINIRFYVEHAQSVQVDLFDITGRRISNLMSHHIPAGGFTHSVNISDLELNPGIYLIRLSVFSNYFTKKIIIN